MRLNTSVSVLALGLLASACATEPTVPVATVAVNGTTFAVTRYVGPRVTWISFSLPVTITNNGRKDINYPHCSFAVMLGEESSFEVFRPVCIAMSSTTVIPAGESLQLTLPVTAAIEGPGGPEWALHEVNGLFRLTVGLNGGVPGERRNYSSNTFRLEE